MMRTVLLISVSIGTWAEVPTYLPPCEDDSISAHLCVDGKMCKDDPNFGILGHNCAMLVKEHGASVCSTEGWAGEDYSGEIAEKCCMSCNLEPLSTWGSLDNCWTMVAAILVFFMQAGFMCLEAGTVAAKNAQGILIKNLLDSCVGAMVWWLLGYGLAFGNGETPDKFIGSSLFAAVNEDYANTHYVGWFFQWAFCSAAATIVSGAVAERVSLHGYALFMMPMTGFIYPTVVHWTWGGGWLSDGEDGIYQDFAGSGIVHMCGGVAALAGAAIVGPRTGRFDPSQAAKFVPHSVPLVVLGVFILWFGWYGFNCGSTVAMSAGSDNTAALIAMTTTLSAAAGGITVFFVKFAMTGQHDVCALANGVLAGLVSITAGCDGVYGWAALVMGAIGGFIFIGVSALLKKLKVDDPVDAFAVHGACGAWGVIAVAFFNMTGGIFYGGEDSGKLLAWQVIGILGIAAWTGILAGGTFLILKIVGVLRLSKDDEEKGADEHSPTKAYNWGEVPTEEPKKPEPEPEKLPIEPVEPPIEPEERVEI